MTSRPAYHRMTPQKQELVLRTTIELVRVRGYADVTIEDVARRCESSKATIYRFWPGKAALVAAALLHSMPTAADFPDSGSLRQDMLALFRAPESEPEFDPFMIATFVAMGYEAPQVYEETNRRIVAALKAVIDVFLQRAADRGEHRMSPESAAAWRRTCCCFAIGYAPSVGERLTQDAFEDLYDRVLQPVLDASLRQSTTS